MPYNSSMDDLFGYPEPPAREVLADGAMLLRGFAREQSETLLAAVQDVAAAAPFRHMSTPGGYRMSVAMTGCGATGWVSGRRGYRYQTTDPTTGQPWPSMPECFTALAARAAAAAGFGDYLPNTCLINRYAPGARLSLHQDRDEGDLHSPIVSVSLGLPAVFLFGGARRSDRPHRYRLTHGDVAVWGGPARLAFHGVAALAQGHHPATGGCRINLTFRRTR